MLLFKLLRVKQYYKNFLVFLALIFAGLFTDLNAILVCGLGFVALCLISSANYILNDFINLDEDRKHSDKRLRPLASGNVSLKEGLIVAFIIAVISLILGMYLSKGFFYMLLLMFFLTQIYSLYFRKEIFLDVLFISFNFVIRAVSGALILNVRISPWLILCTFFLSLFIAVGKRRVELVRGVKREVLKLYNEEILNTLMVVTSALLFVSYGMYSFLSVYPLLIYSIPFAFYVIFRYLYLVYSGSLIGMKTELFYQDIRLVIGIIVWVLVSSGIIYISL